MKQRHGHKRFYELLDLMADLHSKKNADYCGNKDPLANLKLCRMMGVDPFVGCVVRLGDKFSRLCSFVEKGYLEVKDEKITDTLLDNAVYSLLAIILLEEGKNGK
jgi:hypothetical protein